MSYVQPSNNNFSEYINKKYKKYTIPKKKKSIKEICFPKEFELQIPQEFLSEYINPKTPYKGLLIFHRIGAGKTCTAISIAEKWKDKRKIIVVVPASLIGNFRTELRSQCAKNSYLTNEERKKLKIYHPSSVEYKQIIKKSDERIDEYYNIYSYNKFVEKAENNEINLRNSLLIVDEIQNMVSEEGKYYTVLYDIIHNSPNNLRVILLSATPMFDKPVEIALTMNLLKIPFEFPTGREFELLFTQKVVNNKTGEVYYKAKNLDIFKERIKGYVSYYRGAPPYAFPRSIIKYVKCEMSEFQYNSYVRVLKSEEKKNNMELRKLNKISKGDIINLPNDFYLGTRFISNVAFPNKMSGEAGFESFKGRYLKLDNLEKYSIKFYKIIKKINNASGPVFVYSNFKEFGGLKSFIRALEGQNFKNYTKFGEGRKRFAIWSSDEKNDIREEIKAVFNQSTNYNGSKLKVIAGSPSTKEGLSFKNVQQVHILEPYWNYSRMLQIIGRAVRYCSHKELPEEKREVKVYIYLATPPANIQNKTIDQWIMNLALKKNRLIQEFELALKEVAVDCTLFKHGNVYKEFNEPDIKCE